MEYQSLIAAIAAAAEPEPSLPPALQALWWDGLGEWERAHELCQQPGCSEGDWIHAYLHRKEGDDGNAAYWYRRAGRSVPSCSLEEEWEDLVKVLLMREALNREQR